MDLLKESIIKILRNEWKTGAIPERWDGRTADRIVEVLLNLNL